MIRNEERAKAIRPAKTHERWRAYTRHCIYSSLPLAHVHASPEFKTIPLSIANPIRIKIEHASARFLS
jgi:hypothetical protein